MGKVSAPSPHSTFDTPPLTLPPYSSEAQCITLNCGAVHCSSSSHHNNHQLPSEHRLNASYHIHSLFPLHSLYFPDVAYGVYYKEANAGVLDQAGQSKGWTGFTFNRPLFDDPTAYMQWCKRFGLHNSMNLHPASGIQLWEETYEAMADAMGHTNRSSYIPLNLTDLKFVTNWANITLRPLEEAGIGPTTHPLLPSPSTQYPLFSRSHLSLVLLCVSRSVVA